MSYVWSTRQGQKDVDEEERQIQRDIHTYSHLLQSYTDSHLIQTQYHRCKFWLNMSLKDVTDVDAVSTSTIFVNIPST
jgi:hypothetical protein